MRSSVGASPDTTIGARSHSIDEYVSPEASTSPVDALTLPKPVPSDSTAMLSDLMWGEPLIEKPRDR